MRIAVFADGSRREGRSIAPSLLAVGRALAHRGHAVMLAIARDEGPDWLDRGPARPELDHGLTMLRLPSLPWRAGRRASRIPTGIAALRCRAWAPDVVHSQAPSGAGLDALAAAWLLQVPLISTRRDPVEPGSREGRVSVTGAAPMALRYARWYYRRCDLVTSPSEGVITALREAGLDRPTRVVSDPLALDPLPGQERRAEAKARRGPGTFALIHAGRLTPEQRVDEIIRAIPSLITRIPGVSLTLVGSGPAEPALRMLAERLQVFTHVRFVGELGAARLLDTYATSDAFVTMSASEASAPTTLGAMASGLPVIGARTRSLSEHVDASRGMLVEPGDTAALVASILALRCEPARAAALGAAGRGHAARFGPEPIAAEWEGIYGEVLSRSRQRRTANARPLPQPTTPPS